MAARKFKIIAPTCDAETKYGGVCGGKVSAIADAMGQVAIVCLRCGHQADAGPSNGSQPTPPSPPGPGTGAQTTLSVTSTATSSGPYAGFTNAREVTEEEAAAGLEALFNGPAAER